MLPFLDFKKTNLGPAILSEPVQRANVAGCYALRTLSVCVNCGLSYIHYLFALVGFRALVVFRKLDRFSSKMTEFILS